MTTATLASWEPDTSVPPDLQNGDHLSAVEFLRRYEGMPGLKKAELVQNIVYMASPVSTHHSEPDSLLQGLIFYYAQSTPGVRSATNQTVRMGPDDVIQPDALLRIESGGACRPDGKGYLVGAPELVAEVAASSVSIDMREKRDSCRRAGVKEYLVWRTLDHAIDWWVLEEDEYRPLPADENGAVTSRSFPGLCINVPALLAADGSTALATLQEALRARPGE